MWRALHVLSLILGALIMMVTFLTSVQAQPSNSTPTESQHVAILVTASPAAAPEITSTPVTEAVLDTLYQYDVEASGAPTPTYALIAAPAGMVVNGCTGLIQWMPTAAGTFTATILAGNGGGMNRQTFRIEVIDPSLAAPIINSTPTTTAKVGTSYSYDVEASGMPTPTFRLSTAPNGMTIDASSGLITWTPTAPGRFDVTVAASNLVGATSQQFIITVSDSPTQAPTIISAPVTTATAGQSYQYDVNANGVPAPTYTLLDSPTGMSIDASTGVIAWTPTDYGVYNVKVRARNSAGVAIQSFIIQVKSVLAVCTSPIRIMPLGDSITRGTGTNPKTGYRQPLYLALTGANYYVDFVGAAQDGETAHPAFDANHEGHSGYQDEQIGASVYRWLTRNPADVVLLHIGTNDLSQTPPDNTTDDIVTILSEIDRLNPAIVVVLARIINRQTYSPETHQFNLDLAAMAEERIANGDKLVVVNQESALNYPNDLSDNLHPNSTGYQKMAHVWMDALDNFLPVCQSFAPLIVSPPVNVALARQPYSYRVEADGTPAPTYRLLGAPTDMTIDATTGLISWTPTITGVYSTVVEATNSVGSVTQFFTVTVEPTYPLFLPIITR